jgi:hypothetical protein
VLPRLLAALLLLTACGVARAQPAPGAARARARELVEAALRHYEARQYAQAAASFRAAHALAPQPKLLYAQAQAERLGGLCAQAVISYRAFLATRPPPRQARAAEEHLARCVARPAGASQPTSAPAGGAPRRGPASPRRAAATPVVELLDPFPDGQPEGPGPRAPWYRDPLGNALAGGGLATFAVGTTLWLLGRDAAQTALAATRYDGYVDHASGALARQQAGVACMIVGAGLAAAGAVRYLLRPPAPTWRRTLLVRPTAGGALLVAAGWL